MLLMVTQRDCHQYSHEQTVTNRHISRRIYNYIKLKKTTSGRLF